jgi:hypothetical protein
MPRYPSSVNFMTSTSLKAGKVADVAARVGVTEPPTPPR